MSNTEFDPRDLDPGPRSTATGKRRLILSAAGLLAVATVAALIIGGGAKPPRPPERKTGEEIIVENKTPFPDGELVDWPDPAIDGEPLPGPGNPGPPAPGMESTGIVKADTPGKTSGPAERPQAPAGSDPAEKTQAATGHPAAGPVSNPPTVAAAGPPEKKSSGEPEAIRDQESGVSATAASGKKPPGEPPPLTARPGTPNPPALAPTIAAATARPAFKKPRSKRTGIVSQTKDLVKQTEIAAQPAATPNAPSPSPGHDRPAAVTQRDAKSYASRLTENLKAANEITKTQTVRLPTSTETNSTKIWRHDDQPKVETETRPFGLVIEETDPASRSALAAAESESPPPSETPEGIPLRTDIPPGTSPLEKNGPDKPLWKRPEAP